MLVAAASLWDTEKGSMDMGSSKRRQAGRAVPQLVGVCWEKALMWQGEHKPPYGVGIKSVWTGTP